MDFNINDFYFYSGTKPDAETLKGKKPYGLCCEVVANVFRGLVHFSPDRDEFNLFRDSFEGHPLTDLESLRENLPKILDEIFERAALLRLDLQAYFLAEMEKEVLRATAENETVSKSRMAFIQQFPKRKAELIKDQTASEKVDEFDSNIPFNIANLFFWAIDDESQQVVAKGLPLKIKPCNVGSPRFIPIFEGLRRFNPTKDEFAIIKGGFKARYAYRILTEHGNLSEILNEIFSNAALLPPDLSDYFLTKLGEIITLGLDKHSVQKLTFHREFDRRMKAIKETITQTPATDETPTKFFTTAQSVLTLFYLMKAAKFDRGKATDLLFAQFVQFITGKEPNTKVKDTTILKRWREVVDERKALNPDDLEAVKSWFEKIGLDVIAEEIGKRKKKKKHKNNKE